MAADPDNRIRILPEAVTSRIAAGEVIERPASVLKELAENALDAGARRLHVDIAGGGRELIRVTDDGCGMSREDLALAVLPHATSKLSSADELVGLTTLGFRGEALPSIASVSKFALSSQRREDAGGNASAWRIEMSGAQPERPEPRPAAGSFGTTVEVRDLFFNLPARAKFLKGEASEAAACTDTLLRLALTRPDVAFTLTQGRHEIFSFLPHAAGADGTPVLRAAGHAAPALPPTAWFQRAREVLGRDNSRGLIEVSTGSAAREPSQPAQDNYRLFGLISPPAHTRPNRAAIYLNVNGRPVKDRTLTSALLEACRHLLPPKRYPVAVLYLELPPADVDINVHPTKAEVRFRAPGMVYALLHHAIRSACGVSSPEPTLQEAAAEHAPGVPAKPPLGVPRVEPGQKTFDLWPHVQPAQAPDAGARAPFAESRPAAAPAYRPSASPAHPAKLAEEAAAFATLAPPASPPLATRAAPPKDNAAGTAPRRVEHPVQPFRVLGQAAGSYIVLEDDTGVKLIDQHALHERILFEEFLHRADGHARGDAQGLLLAETVELSPVQATVFSQNETAAEVLANIGFSVESFGPRTLLVRAVPAVLKSASAAALVSDVLDALADTGESPPSGRKPSDRGYYREKAAYTLACKGALKAGERLTVEQMTTLVGEYRKKVGGGGFTCPHGRPVAVELSWDELERAVGRR